MTALATLTLVWLGAQRPDFRTKAALDRWAELHQARLSDPTPEVETPQEEALEFEAQCEEALLRSRNAWTGEDSDAALVILDGLEQTLRGHPDHFQAAWLMADSYRLRARIAAQVSPELAEVWESRADVLEGVRATAFGTTRKSAGPAESVKVTLVVHGARRSEPFWDGVAVAGTFVAAAGEHHLLVSRGAAIQWSGWVSVLSAGTVDVWVPDDPPCSAGDLAGARFDGRVVRVEPGVRCDTWVLARPGRIEGTVELAVCNKAVCEAPINFSYAIPAERATPQKPAPTASGLPGWASWTLAGAGIVAVGTFAIWQTHAFEHSEIKRVTFDGSKL